MHELSIATQIVKLATRHAEAASASSVSQVELDIGKLSGIELESLRFALSVATRDTLLKDAEFLIHTIEPLFECSSCRHHYAPGRMNGECPSCGEVRSVLIEGNELQIKSLLVE